MRLWGFKKEIMNWGFFRKQYVYIPSNTNMEHYELKHFKVQEFVDKTTYSVRGDKSIALMDWRMLWTADAIREYFGKPMTINNWHVGGDRYWSGVRNPKSLNFSKYSQHTFGRALDFYIAGIDSSKIRKTILDNPQEGSFQYITTLEDFDGMSWVHIDCRVLRKEQKRFLIVKP